MKYSGFSILALLFLILVLFNACGQPQSDWQGTIEEVDGVTVVKNPIEPRYGEIEFNLEEDLSIGNGKDENYRFYRVRAIALDSENNIYVVDRGNYRVQKFDEMGRYLRTIGRKGQGPGEFQGPLGVCLDVLNNLYVLEYKKIHIFDIHGEYTSSFPLDFHLVDFAVDASGHILGYSDLHQRDTARRGIVKMDTEGKIIQTFVEYTDLGIKVVVGQTATFTLSPNHVYTPRLFFASIGQDEYVYGYSSEYLINLIDNEGNPLLKIYKADDSIPISQKEKDFIVSNVAQSLERRQIPISKQMVDETMHFEKARAFYNRILTDDARRLYVQRVRGILDEDEKYGFDIFSYDGYYLYRAIFPFSPEIIRNGYLFDIDTSEDTGEVFIKRYKTINWDQIKTGIN